MFLNKIELWMHEKQREIFMQKLKKYFNPVSRILNYCFTKFDSGCVIVFRPVAWLTVSSLFFLLKVSSSLHPLCFALYC